jgi:pantetheine-phosphate adenylyltransferase
MPFGFTRCRGKRRRPNDFRGIVFSLVKSADNVKMTVMRTAIYPGSFDPLTNGHLDVIQRAVKLFDRVVVAVAKNDGKQPLFTLEERFALVKKAVKRLPNVEADAFDGLLVKYVARRKAQAIVRGLRAVSDFEFEFQLALMNRKLNENVETIFMMPRETYTFLSSRLVKEIARLGGDVGAFVPAHVKSALAQKFAGEQGD